jgi:hypothetical protein
MRMQSLLFGMHWLRRHLLPLPAATQGPPCCAGVRTLKSLSLSLSGRARDPQVCVRRQSC